VGVAFIDTQIYTHQILTIKSLLLVADVYKSISLLRFQEEYRTLSLVSRVCEQLAAAQHTNKIFVKGLSAVRGVFCGIHDRQYYHGFPRFGQ
jgi:hypothetical protein